MDNTTLLIVAIVAGSASVFLFIISAFVICKYKLCCKKKGGHNEELDSFLGPEESEDEGTKLKYSEETDEGTFHYVDVIHIEERDSEPEDVVVIENNVVLDKSSDDGQNWNIAEHRPRTTSPVESSNLDINLNEEPAIATTAAADTEVPPPASIVTEPSPNISMVLDVESTPTESPLIDLPPTQSAPTELTTEVASATTVPPAAPITTEPQSHTILALALDLEADSSQSEPLAIKSPIDVRIELAPTESTPTESTPTQLAPIVLPLTQSAPSELSPTAASTNRLSLLSTHSSSLSDLSSVSASESVPSATEGVPSATEGVPRKSKKKSTAGRKISHFTKEFSLNAKLKISLQYMESVKCLKGTIMSIAGLNFEVDSTPDEISFHLRFVPSKKFHILTKYKPASEDTHINLTFTMGPVRKDDLANNQLRIKLYGRKSQLLTRSKCFGECSYNLADVIGKPYATEYEEKVLRSELGGTYSSDSDLN